MITAILIDSREPAWVQKLQFGGVPTSVAELESGDLWAVTDTGHTLVIERKTPDDLLGSIKDNRLFPQMARLAQYRYGDQSQGKPVTHWPYLVICGSVVGGADGKAVTPRGQTGWNFASVQGALLSIQEMGVFIVYANNDLDFEATVLRLGERNRDQFMDILPARTENVWGAPAAFIASLPGIGLERTKAVMDWAGNVPAHALSGLVDLEIEAPVPLATRRKIRNFLGLREGQELAIRFNELEDEIIKATNGGSQ